MKQLRFRINITHKKHFKPVLITILLTLFIYSASIQVFQEEMAMDLLNDNLNVKKNIPKSSNLFENGILYTGNEDSLLINETAIHSSSEHFIIGNDTNPLYTSENAEFPIDTSHDWEGYYYNATISNILDERDWINNGGFGSNTGLSYSSQVSQTEDSGPSYGKNLNPSNYLATFDGSNCDYMRIHFDLIEVEYYYDALYISDETNTIIDYFAGYYTDFYTPWYDATELKISMDSDNSVELYGYSVDFFQTYNGSMVSIDSTNWNYFEDTITDPTRMYGSTTEQGNHSALGIVIEGIDNSPSYSYEDGDISGYYQEFTIPRGQVLDAWVSMDYNLLRGIDTNDNYAFIKINGETVYTRGFRTITSAGLGQWHSTGLINLALWENSTNIFDDIVNDQSLNISFGIEIGNGVEYTGFDHLDIQEAYFDNLQLIVKTRANSTQTNINIEFDGFSLTDSASEWGSAIYHRFNSWDSNPMQISISADAPKIEFDMISNVYGYHNSSSQTAQYGIPGSHLTIYTNKTVRWETYHNAYIPNQYSDFEFEGMKPLDWNIYEIKDPTGISTSYSGGENSEATFSISTSSSGWWKISAESTNMLESSNTELFDGSWVNYLNTITYDVGELIGVRTDLNMSVGPISNVLSTSAELTIYHPNETEWYSDTITPDISGSIVFPTIEVGARNTSGGIYHYSLIWTNGTAAGGLNGTFEVLHSLQHTLLYPRDAISDFDTENVFGDIIPIRLVLNDSSTGEMLTNLHTEYNWTTGNSTLNEISAGIYDISLDSLDLLGSGRFFVEFTVSGEGFYSLYFTLTINLVSETELKIIGLDNNIDYGTNFTIDIDYHTKPGSIGITNAIISLNLSDYHVVEQVTDGFYSIEINSSNSFLGSGTYDIQINASQTDYFTQELVTRIQILPRSIYFEVLINSSDCTLNKSYSTTVHKDFNFTVGVFESAGDAPVLTGTVQLVYGGIYSDPFTIINERYYGSINSSFFGLGVHFVSIIFNETGYQSAAETIQINIAPISVDFDIQINSADCNTNKSYSTEIRQTLEFAIRVETLEDSTLVTVGTVQITIGSWTSNPFTLVSDIFIGTLNTTEMGTGIHYINIIFDSTGYTSKSQTIQVNLLPIVLNTQFEDNEDTLIVDTKDDFSKRITLRDPNTLEPILNATVTYIWDYGTGELTEIGNGVYKFQGTAPNRPGSYDVTITITTDNPDFAPITLSMTIFSQSPDSSVEWWWFVAAAGVLVSALSGTLIAIGVKNNRKKRKETDIALLKRKTQIFDDITNIKGILLIEKNSGLLMYRHIISGLDEGNEELFSGFVRAILLLGKRFIRDEEELEKGMVFEKQEFIEFTHENFKIMLAGGNKIIVALILEEQASEELKSKAAKFIEEFEGIYASVLDGWTGNRTVFRDTTPKLFEEIFSLSLLREFYLSKNSEIYAKKFITPNSISERVSNVIYTLHEEKESFHLKTIISLIPEDEKLAAKNQILKFIKGRYIVPKK